jgi:transcriptional regulator with XRE-family HTH domain
MTVFVNQTAYDLLSLNEKIGINIAIARKQQGLTRQQLAAKLHLGDDAIRNMEEAIIQNTPDRLELIAKVLSCDISYLIPVFLPNAK